MLRLPHTLLRLRCYTPRWLRYGYIDLPLLLHTHTHTRTLLVTRWTVRLHFTFIPPRWVTVGWVVALPCIPHYGYHIHYGSAFDARTHALQIVPVERSLPLPVNIAVTQLD